MERQCVVCDEAAKFRLEVRRI